MRVDVFLKLTRILKQRTLAKQACDAGSVTVNGEAAKPGTLVRAGDRLRVDLPAFQLEAVVVDVPRTTNVPRKDVERYIKILERQARHPHDYVFGDDSAGDDASDDASEDASDDASIADHPTQD
jgi:ribosomal 50S subunit-recycling heat shock protein